MSVNFNLNDKEVKAVMEAVAHRLEWYRENSQGKEEVVSIYEGLLRKVSSADKRISSDLKYIQDAMKAGVTDYIVKPINPNIVLEKSKRHLSGK